MYLKRSKQRHGDAAKIDSQIISDYKENQEKLIKIYNKKQKLKNKEQELQTGNLKNLVERSEAFGDNDFSAFAQNLIDKEYKSTKYDNLEKKVK